MSFRFVNEPKLWESKSSSELRLVILTFIASP
jgi:hypothetical protein